MQILKYVIYALTVIVHVAGVDYAGPRGSDDGWVKHHYFGAESVRERCETAEPVFFWLLGANLQVRGKGEENVSLS